MPDSQRFGLTHQIAGMSPQLSRIVGGLRGPLARKCSMYSAVLNLSNYRSHHFRLQGMGSQALNASDGEILWTFEPDVPVWNFLALFPDKDGDVRAGLGGRIPLGEYDNPRGDHYHSLSTVCIYNYIYICLLLAVAYMQIDETKMDEICPLVGCRFQILGVCLFFAMSFVSVWRGLIFTRKLQQFSPWLLGKRQIWEVSCSIKSSVAGGFK